MQIITQTEFIHFFGPWTVLVPGIALPYTDPRVAELSNQLKLESPQAIEAIAVYLAPQVRSTDLLVPIPGRTGVPTYTLALAQAIGRITASSVESALTCQPHPPRAVTLPAPPPAFALRKDFMVAQGGRVFLLDNLVATGATMLAAQKLLPNATALAYAYLPRHISVVRSQAGFPLQASPLRHRPAQFPTWLFEIGQWFQTPAVAEGTHYLSIKQPLILSSPSHAYSLASLVSAVARPNKVVTSRFHKCLANTGFDGLSILSDNGITLWCTFSESQFVPADNAHQTLL